ncbi:TonB-dependent receptor, partial [Bradyrhizobium sp. Pear77]|nr:TonB-dependent receptor [Bradyrhizobium altum]
MFSILSHRRRRALLLASTMIAPTIVLSTARAQQVPSPNQLPAIEITRPGDQNFTRAKPAADEAPAPRRPAPGTTQGNNVGSGAGSN